MDEILPTEQQKKFMYHSGVDEVAPSKRTGHTDRVFGESQPPENNEDLSSDDSDVSGDESSEDVEHEEPIAKWEYHEHVEPIPLCAAYDRHVAQVGDDAIHIAKSLLVIIDGSICKTGRVRECCYRAIPQAREKSIALLGNTGAGKSSLLNSQPRCCATQLKATPVPTSESYPLELNASSNRSRPN